MGAAIPPPIGLPDIHTSSLQRVDADRVPVSEAGAHPGRVGAELAETAGLWAVVEGMDTRIDSARERPGGRVSGC